MTFKKERGFMETVESILAKIYDAIDDKIGQDIVILNIGKVSSL